MLKQFSVILALSLVLYTSSLAQALSEKRNGKNLAVRILKPDKNKVIALGEPLDIQWEISPLPPHRKDWVVDVSLHYSEGCAAAMGQGITLYSGPISKSPGKLHWKANSVDLHWIEHPSFYWDVGHPEPMRVRVCLYNGAEDEGQMFAMGWKSCHAVPDLGSDTPICVLSKGTVRFITPQAAPATSKTRE
jgi:hypothetical protein